MTWAKEAAVSEASRLAGELTSLQGQVGPVAAAVERSQREASLAQTLKRERGKMFSALAVRANSIAYRLGARDSPIPPSDDDVGAYLQFFTQIMEKLDGVATNLNNVVEEECRELLSLAATRVFSNLRHANPNFDFASVLQRVEPSLAFELAKEVKEPVEALVKLYRREDDGSAESSDGASGDAPDESTGASGSPAPAASGL